MIVAGVMSGTSADGIDVAFVRINHKSRLKGDRGQSVGGQGRPPHMLFLGHADFPYPAGVRRIVLSSMNSPSASVADLSRLNFLLGEIYADAVLSAQQKLRIKAQLVGCHGQTLYHQGAAASFLGRKLAVTWQTGEASVIAARTGIPVISDFRPADMAVGGRGAPLVPYLDYILYRDPSLGRIALNIGGIANLTAIPANAALERIIAFDTGPGNMVIDALMEDLFKKPFDRDGKVAASGHVLEDVISSFLRESYFRLKPPKTTGREEFGREFARQFRRVCGSPNPLKGAKGGAATLRDLGAGVVPDALVRGGRTMAFAPTQPSSRDAIATATALTVRSIGDAVNRFVLPRGSFFEVIASGGGTKNPTLMAWLANELGDSGLRLRSSDEFGIPSEAKEAIAFAVLAFETWNRRPSNVPSATGARRGAVLGKISFP